MNKWKIEIILNSGKELTVYYKGYEINSTDVCEQVVGGGENTFYGFSGMEVVDEIASIPTDYSDRPKIAMRMKKVYVK